MTEKKPPKVRLTSSDAINVYEILKKYRDTSKKDDGCYHATGNHDDASMAVEATRVSEDGTQINAGHVARIRASKFGRLPYDPKRATTLTAVAAKVGTQDAAIEAHDQLLVEFEARLTAQADRIAKMETRARGLETVLEGIMNNRQAAK